MKKIILLITLIVGTVSLQSNAQTSKRTTTRTTKIKTAAKASNSIHGGQNSTQTQISVKKGVIREPVTQQNIAEALQITKDGILGIKLSDKVYSIRNRKMRVATTPDDFIGREGPQWKEEIRFKLGDLIYTQEHNVEIMTGTTKKCLVDYNNDTQQWYWNDNDHLSYLWADIQRVEIDDDSPRKKEMLSCICKRLDELCVSKEKISETKYVYKMDNGLRFEAFITSITLHLYIYDESVY